MLLKNIQLLAQDAGASGGEENKDVASDNQTDKKDTNKDTKEIEQKTIQMTQEELDKLITKRLERERKKAEEEKVEAEKLAKMSEAERQKALFDKEKSSFEDERKQFQREKLELQVTKELNTKGLPIEFSKYLLGNSAENCMSNIKEFETTWQKALEKAINEKLKGKTPRNSSTGTDIKESSIAEERNKKNKNSYENFWK